MEQEKKYLSRVTDYMKNELKELSEKIKSEDSLLRDEHLYMWEETGRNTQDFERLGELITALDEVSVRTDLLRGTVDRYNKLRKNLPSPYFGRIDFLEDGQTERMYIGNMGIIDRESYDALVYDWRSPAASMYYRFSLGDAYYMAPSRFDDTPERYNGVITLKRQYVIKKGKLEFFCDTDRSIIDELLMRALSKNAGEKMRTIVETIQARQDEIIRDEENRLLIVQGCAGSGKTSVALHRAAYLLYSAMESKNVMKSDDVLILSPGDMFSGYISDVLPELGEEKTRSELFENMFLSVLPSGVEVESRFSFMERLITNRNKLHKQYIEFKGSKEFMTILKRLGTYCIKRLVPFEDLYYAGSLVMSAEEQRAYVLRSGNVGYGIRLERLTERVKAQISQLYARDIARYIKMFEHDGSFTTDSVRVARRMAAAKRFNLLKTVSEYGKIRYIKLYRSLFKDRELFKHLAKGLTLPENIGELLEIGKRESAAIGPLKYEDAAAVSYLVTCLRGSESGDGAYKRIRHVIVDEAQDYSLIHYGILKNICVDSRFTLLGDIGQAITGEPDMGYYDEIAKLFSFERSAVMILDRSYRSSVEIQEYASKIYPELASVPGLERHDAPVEHIESSRVQETARLCAKSAGGYVLNGFDSIAIICRSEREAKELYSELTFLLPCELRDEKNRGINATVSGINVMPVSAVKGLEFDAVVVIDTFREDERRLKYVAATRALHRLTVIKQKK
ncbi:MAG: AAA family ATPase [Clostridiales bacterium]|nr:AAA family ATPase [Clostridiales bacterium]